MNKKCSKCRWVKPFGEFFNDRSRKLGKSAYCKACSSKRRPYAEWKTDAYIEGYTTEKTCKDCHVAQTLDKFKIYPEHRRSKTGTYSSVCLECLEERTLNATKRCRYCNIDRTRRDFVNSHKCTFCVQREQERKEQQRREKQERIKIKKQQAKKRKQKINQQKEHDDLLLLRGLWPCHHCKETLDISKFSTHLLAKRAYKCKECDKRLSQEWYNSNKPRIAREAHERYHSLTPEENERRKEVRRKYQAEKRASDPVFKLRNNMGKAIRRSLEGAEPGVFRHLPYTPSELRNHLAAHLKPGMTMENYGSAWEVDHYIPINVFRCKRPEDKRFRICWSLDNLYPLESAINSRKSGTIPSFDYDDFDQKKF